MDLTTPNDVISKEYTHKELGSKSRNRSGFHVFISCFFHDFKKLSIDEQRQQLSVLDETSSRESVDSTDTDFYKIKHPDVMKLGCYYWRNNVPPQVKEAWTRRAEYLNSREVPGKFVTVPAEIGGGGLSTNDFLMEALTVEWSKLLAVLRSSVVTNQRRVQKRGGNSLSIICFGKERVVVGSQTYRQLNISYLLKLVIFGGKNNNRINMVSEFMKTTKRTTLIHIASQRRIEEMLTINNQCGVSFRKYFGKIDQDRKYYTLTCSGKVSLKNKENKKIILGYIINETNDKWQIQVEGVNGGNDNIFWINRLQYSFERDEYILNENIASGGYSITNYWPIRLLLNEDGNCKFIFNRLGLDSQNQIISNTSS